MPADTRKGIETAPTEKLRRILQALHEHKLGAEALTNPSYRDKIDAAVAKIRTELATRNR